MNKLITLVRDETGATLVEYAILALLITIVAVVAIIAVGLELSNQFISIGGTISR